MSRSVDLFIDADVSLAEMSGVLGECLGAPLRPEGLSEWVFDQGQVQAKLSEHPYRDDGELLFSRYRFVVSARVANDVRPQDSPQAALLRQLAHQIQQGPAWPLLVVHDLQYRDGLPAPGPSLRIEDAAGEGGPGAGAPGERETRGREARGREARGWEARGWEARGWEARGWEARGWEARGTRTRWRGALARNRSAGGGPIPTARRVYRQRGQAAVDGRR